MRVTRAVIALGLLAGTLALPPQLAVAGTAGIAPGSCYTHTDEQVGTSAYPHAPLAAEGVKATMTTPGGYVLCTSVTNPKTNFSTAWVMVQGSSSGTGYVQDGTMYRYGFSCPEWFAEESSDGTNFTDYYLDSCAPQDDTTHNIQVSYVNGGSGYHFQEVAGQGSLIHNSSLNLSIIKGTVFTPYNAEVRYEESHVPGSASTPVTFTNMEQQNLSNDSWYDDCGNTAFATGAFPYGGRSTNSCDSTSLWDTRN